MKNANSVPKVVIANVFKQHSHQLAISMQQNHYLICFFTGFWGTHKKLFDAISHCFPSRLRENALLRLSRRFTLEIDSSLIIQMPFIEVKHRYFKPWKIHNYLLNVSKEFDKKVCKHLGTLDFDIFIGYEMGSLECFRMCKNRKKIAIMDQSSIGFNYQQFVFNKYRDNYSEQRVKQEEAQKRQEILLADYFLVPSILVRDSLIDLGIPKHKIFIVPYGVDHEIFQPKKTYKMNENLKILFVGHIQLYKGIEFLFDAIEKINDRRIQLTLVGKMGDAVKIAEKYRGHFIHVKSVEQAQLAKIFTENDLFVLPSLIEGFAQVTLEAMATGTPVIVSNRTGSHEAVRDGIDGFVVPFDNVDTLRNRILLLLNNKENIAIMGKNAAEQSLKYSWSIYRKNVCEVIKSLGRYNLK